MKKKIKLEPIVSEKSTNLAACGKFSFRAPIYLGKKEAQNLIEDNFKVKIVKMRSITSHSKMRRTGKSTGMTKPYKKLIATLKKGQKIDIFEVSNK